VTELVIIADDLTGAADSAALMTRRGSTSIVLDPDEEWPPAEVVAVDTDSRHRAPGLAAARVAAAARRARQLGAPVFKKVDSTMRGNIAVELRALTGALGGEAVRPLVVMAAAFPAMSRTTVGGVVHVDGTRLDAHGSDGDLVGLLTRGGLRTRPLGLRALAAAAELAAALDAAHAAGEHAVVVDGVTEQHLETVAAAARLARCPLVLAGSGGLGRALAGPAAEASVVEDAGERPPWAVGEAQGGHALVVVGSHAPQARAQLARLAERGVRIVWLDGPTERTSARLRDGLRSGPVALAPDAAAPVVRGEAPRVARALAAATVAALDEAGHLVTTGGETARAVLGTLGVTRLDVLGELEPGVVRCAVPGRGLRLTLKAGAFGDPDTLLRCLAWPSHPGSRTTGRPLTPPVGETVRHPPGSRGELPE
jgi:uncharacterized protein YgbK (DUF1537 family)